MVTRQQNTIKIISKYGTWLLLMGFASMSVYAAEPTPIAIPVIDNIGVTAKALLKGNGALIIDTIILAGAGYGSAISRNPAPIIFGIISCAIFHLAIAAMLG